MTLPIRTLALVGSLVVAGIAGAAAQADVQWGTDPAAVDVECATTQCLLGRVPVRGAPFAAAATIVWRPASRAGLGELRAQANYYRDGQGRVRIERSFAGRGDATREVLLAPDAASATMYLLDPVARTVAVIPRGLAQMMVGAGGHSHFTLPVSSRRMVSVFERPKSVAATGLDTWEPLGQRYISGVAARGVGLTAAVPHADGRTGYAERWVSDELNLVLDARIGDASMGVFEYHVTKISRTEPPASMFELPAGYTERPLEFPLVWMNAYKMVADQTRLE